MTLAELLPEIKSLGRGEKLQLIQLLAEDVAREEQLIAGWKDKTFEIWSPYNCDEAANTLGELLKAAKSEQE